MTRHGVSHAAAALVTVVVAPLIVEQLRGHLPVLGRAFEAAAHWLVLHLALRPPLTIEMVTSLLVAAALAFVWGIAFAALHRA